MRFQSLSGTLLFGNFLFFIFATPILAATSDILLSEFQIESIDQKGKTQTKDEFVELYNTTGKDIPLDTYKLVRKTSTGTTSSLRSNFKSTDIIPAKSFYLLVNKEASVGLLSIKDNEFISAGTLAPDNSLALLDEKDTPLDSIVWGTGSPFSVDDPVFPNPAKNTSLSRDTTTLTWTVTSTPTPTNSKGVTWTAPQSDPIPIPDPMPVPTPSSPVALRINEILSNPTGNETEGEFIELYNESERAASLDGYTLRDASKTGLYTFPITSSIAGNDYFVLTRSVSKLSLNNSNETLSLFDAAGVLIDSVQYEKTKEGISQNRVGNTLRGGTPTPGHPNQLNTLPETKERVPKKGYRGVTVAFDARGKDADGGKLKYTWDFGDGHKSYKEETTHKYTENGTYPVTLTTTDGSDDITETFTVKIESFPKPEVRITALVPNPSGRDSDAEWLLIENRDKKPVDLKNYSIATGWKKLINHPVRESFIIAPKSEAKLTREFSLFTLPNEKGKIELRAPDGKVLQEIRYKLEKAADEDAIYTKEKGKRWEWRAATNTSSKKEPSSERIAPETIPDEEGTIPEAPLTPEEPPLEQTETEPALSDTQEQQVLGVTTSQKEHQQYLELLNYGTEVKVPKNIVLSFPESDINEPLPERDHYAITFAKVIFENINTALNAAQNKAWGGQAL